MAVTQKQIAEKLGVSVTVVSRVLSGKAEEVGISQGVISRVMNEAEELGYVSGAAALSIKGKASRTIGVVVYDFNDPFFGSLIKQIQIEARKHNYSLLLAGFLSQNPDEQDLQPLYKHAVSGIIILGSDTKTEWLHKFRHCPITRIGHGFPEENSLRITVDEDDAAGRLMQYLAAGGRKNLICISGARPVHRLRQEAMEKAASAAGLPLFSVVSAEKNSLLIGRQVTQQLLSTASLHDYALVCVTDQIAMGALHTLNDADISVPGQIAVTGFDDIPTAEQFIPTITTVRQPTADMVRIAVEAIVRQEEPGGEPEEILLQAELVVRDSA
ncbi:MAG: LacI family transcriptional regulator [Pontiellaceae bacterium]|nr:LacI family transcriptional regulator [Pontiellaceae bacterium]